MNSKTDIRKDEFHESRDNQTLEMGFVELVLRAWSYG